MRVVWTAVKAEHSFGLLNSPQKKAQGLQGCGPRVKVRVKLSPCAVAPTEVCRDAVWAWTGGVSR